MQILDFTWFAKLSDATTSMFSKRKDIAEDEFDSFYLAQEWMREKKYMRTVVYRFREGNANPLQPGTNYVKVTVEHHFRSDSDVTFEEFETKHSGFLQLTQGKFYESFSVVPNSLVQKNQTCSAESMARLSADFFVVAGNEEPVTIGLFTFHPVDFTKKNLVKFLFLNSNQNKNLIFDENFQNLFQEILSK